MNWANWENHAAWLAGQVTHPVSRWRPVVAAVPRHQFTPRWWTGHGGGWELRDGPAMPLEDWLGAVYRDTTLITQVGTRHADHAIPGDRAEGPPTSSSTLPGLLVQMYRHAMIADNMQVLDVGTGTGYGTALLATRLGSARVTSIDVDGYLVKAATERLASIGLHPAISAGDATGPLPAEPGTIDRIIATVAVPHVPPGWLTALRTGGRLVTTITGTHLIVTADKTPDGGAAGGTEWDRAGFMSARSGPGYPPATAQRLTEIRDAEGEHVSQARHPVTDVRNNWDLYSAMGIIAPGIEHHYERAPGGTRTAWMIHPDGSWARASAAEGEPPAVHQSGPRRLYDALEGLRDDWLDNGFLPAYGAHVTITPDGSITFRRGHWTATIPAAP